MMNEQETISISDLPVDGLCFQEKRDQFRTIQYAGIDEWRLLLSIGSIDIGISREKQSSNPVAVVFLIGEHG